MTTKPITLMDQNWDFVLSMFPTGWESLAWATKAVQHFRGGVKSLPNLMRIFFLHIANGYSLKETAARSELAGFGTFFGVGPIGPFVGGGEVVVQMGLALGGGRGAETPVTGGINI